MTESTQIELRRSNGRVVRQWIVPTASLTYDRIADTASEIADAVGLIMRRSSKEGARAEVRWSNPNDERSRALVECAYLAGYENELGAKWLDTEDMIMGAIETDSTTTVLNLLLQLHIHHIVTV